MSRASRSDTPERAPRAPPSLSSVSPPAPRSQGGDRTPPNPASAQEDCGCVCLERLQSAAPADQLPVPFPTCRRQRMHLGCLAQYRAQATSPPRLAVPLCRHSRCPDCSPGGWSGLHDEHLRSMCRRQGVVMPERVSGQSTVREAVRDYQLRTFTANDAPEPRPPPGISVLCCNRLAAIERAGGVDFVPLPIREMPWAPVPVRHSTGIAARRPGCAEEVRVEALQISAEAGGPCSRCGNETRGAHDRLTRSGPRSCAGPDPPFALPGAPHAAAAILPSCL